MANKVWRIWFLWEYSISHGHWGNLHYPVKSWRSVCRSDLALIWWSQSQIRRERLSWSALVMVKEVRLSLNVARRLMSGQDGLFLSTIVGRSHISPPNTDNQIFAVAHNIAKYLWYSLQFFVTISPGICRGSKRTINGQQSPFSQSEIFLISALLLCCSSVMESLN